MKSVDGHGALRRGLTVIELLLALVIAAVLTAIAIPAYRNHVIRSQRADAIAALLRVQSAQEKYFVQYGRYATQLTAEPPAGLGLPETSDRGYYRVQLQASEEGVMPPSYIATAIVVPGGGADDDRRCRSFSIDQNGLRRAYDADAHERADDCWR